MPCELNCLIRALLDEVKRLKDIQETHKDEIHKLEENIDAKSQHINKLKSQLGDDDFQETFVYNKETLDLKSNENNQKQINSKVNSVPHVSSLPKQNSSNVKDLQEVQTEILLDHIRNNETPLDKYIGEHEQSEPSPIHDHIEDNEQFLNCERKHMQNIVPNFLSSLQYQLSERNHFRFAEDLQLPPGTSLAGRLGDSLIPKGDPMEAKLQEMLRYNMDKYSNQNLDTLHISRRVRELLSVHNIGQRLFAKYVLGLSQGTVSELLSKPKPWDKLTEKGRDSYRKMHAWACDDSVVLLLKSLIPKKDSAVQPFGKYEENLNEDKANSMPNSTINTQPNSSNHLGYDSNNDEDLDSEIRNKIDDYPKDHFSRIYQEEFAKIMRTQRNITPNLPGANMRINLENYQKEVLKMQQCTSSSADPKLCEFPPSISNGAQDLSMPKDTNIGKEIKTTPADILNKTINETIKNDEYVEKSPYNIAYPGQELRTSSPLSMINPNELSPLGNSILTPSVMSTSEDLSTSASPLQRMASITNSLISQPSVLQPHNTQQRPSKAILPPITQQQFDLFSNLNTEDIVRRVKEALSQYSISQRLFGESVLGLSQGSVSDLLARPKPWHMLTQKGREPFIRMKMFLEDENAVHKLVASQYKIAPEKLMRTGSYANNPQLNHVLNNKMNATNTMQKIMNEMHQIQASTIPLVTHHNNIILSTPPIVTSHLNSPFNQMLDTRTVPLQSPHQQPNNLRNVNHHKSPTVYEMAALTQDLDTQVITTKIKEALLAHNIGQKIFGEVVLGLSQGSVSELLSKPKPWHMLSIKGREPFIRMQLWLTDPNNIERLQYIKNERREASKKRKSSGSCLQDNSSDTSSNDTSDFYATSPDGLVSSNSSTALPNKKQRVLFSEEQKEALRVAFTLDPYPNVSTIEFLASELGLATRTITNWFHNHRMRLKQQIPHGHQTESLPSRDHSNTPFDPVQFKVLLNQRLVEHRKASLHLPYQQCYPNNSNLATLLSRSLIPSCNEQDLQSLNEAFKEQMKGLDLSLNYNIKKEPLNSFDGDDTQISDSESSINDDSKSINQTEISHLLRTSRRKPVAPQWVNPDWQGCKNLEDQTINSNEPENGINKTSEKQDKLSNIQTGMEIKKENEDDELHTKNSSQCNFS